MSHPASALDAWTGTVTGSMVEHGHRDNQDPDPDLRLIVDDDQAYRIRFSFGFRVTENGDIVGTGQGEYLEASWHIEGTNGGQQVLCDPVMTVPETFDVEVVGQANGRSLEVEFRLIDVMESNPETDCGGNFTAYAVESFEIVGSMNTADARMVTLDQANPSLAPIALHESIQDGDRLREVDHEWTSTSSTTAAAATTATRRAPATSTSTTPGTRSTCPPPSARRAATRAARARSRC
jgi:hypothetical protein